MNEFFSFKRITCEWCRGRKSYIIRILACVCMLFSLSSFYVLIQIKSKSVKFILFSSFLISFSRPRGTIGSAYHKLTPFFLFYDYAIITYATSISQSITWKFIYIQIDRQERNFNFLCYIFLMICWNFWVPA